jgi:hypothetical protein
MRSAAKREK